MKIKSFVTVQFSLDESEKNTMENALEIMRKFREKFLTSGMPEHEKQIAECRDLLWNIVNGKEISE